MSDNEQARYDRAFLGIVFRMVLDDLIRPFKPYLDTPGDSLATFVNGLEGK